MSARDEYGVLLAAPVFGAATAFRAGAGYLGVWSTHAPRLMRMGLDTWTRRQGEEDVGLQDELVAFARESTEVVVDEINRGIADLEAYGSDRGPGR